MKKGTVSLVIMGVVGLLLLGAPSPGAAQYLGETTWTISKTQNEHGEVSPPQTKTLTGAITRMGGPYYTMQGYVDLAPDGPFIVSGGGVLIGSMLYLTLSVSQQHAAPNTSSDTAVMHVELNQAALTGSFFIVWHAFDTSTAGLNPIFNSYFTAGTLTRSGPTISLTPGVPLSLLLLEQ